MQQPAEFDAGLLGHQLGQAVGVGQGQVHHPRGVADAGLGGHGAVGDDLCHLVLPVLVHHIVDHPLPSLVVEVGVDIGHALAVRVQEALEQQVVLDGVDVGDADAVGHGTAGGAAPARAHHHADLPALVDEVLRDQEVAREAHRPDGEELEVQPLLDPWLQAVHPAVAVQVALHRALVGQVRQVLVLVGEALGNGVVRQQDVLLQLQHLHLVHDGVGVVQRLGHVAERGRHLGLRLEEELVVVEGEAGALGLAHLVVEVLGLGGALLLAGVDAQQDVVRVGVLLVHVMAVVAGDHRHVELLRPAQQHRVHLVLLGDAVPLKLDVVVLTEEVQPPLELLEARLLALAQDGAWHAGGQAAGGGDQSFVVLQDQLLVDPRVLAVEALDVAQRTELHQVAVARGVLGQHQLVAALVAVLAGELLLVAVLHHIELAAHDGLHLQAAVVVAVLARFGHELEDPEHVAVVGDGQGGLPIGGGLLVQVRDGGGAVQQAELRVDVEVRERGHRERGTGRSWKAFKGTRQGREKGASVIHRIERSKVDHGVPTLSSCRPPTASTPPCNNTTGVP